jgi:hypothetical protein
MVQLVWKEGKITKAKIWYKVGLKIGSNKTPQTYSLQDFSGYYDNQVLISPNSCSKKSFTFDHFTNAFYSKKTCYLNSVMQCNVCAAKRIRKNMLLLLDEGQTNFQVFSIQ